MSQLTQPSTFDILQGTLDLLILRALSLEPMHGWAISQRIRSKSGGVFAVNQVVALPGSAPAGAQGLVEF